MPNVDRMSSSTLDIWVFQVLKSGSICLSFVIIITYLHFILLLDVRKLCTIFIIYILKFIHSAF